MRSASSNPLLMSSAVSPASSSAFIMVPGSGRPSKDADQHLEIKSQTSPETPSLGSGRWAGCAISPMILPSSPKEGCFPVSTWTMVLAFVRETENVCLPDTRPTRMRRCHTSPCGFQYSDQRRREMVNRSLLGGNGSRGR